MLDKDLQTQAFHNTLEKLNPVQRQAVEQTEGPILVVAGPGTGKTQILSARIGNILASTDTEPHNILCLTYTDAGTIAMRKRLFDMIGVEAYRIHIFTFHAFCNHIIQDNLDIFGYRELQPVSELESLQIFHSLIDSFSADNPLKRFSGEIYFDTNRLQDLFQTMKKEAWSPLFLEKAIDDYLADLPNREEYQYKRANSSKNIKVGDLKVSLLEKEKEKMDKLLAAVKGFEYVNHKMEEARRYDYNDMILWVLNKFKEDPNVLLNYQEKYHYFLVDEYQDTNGAQNEILNLLTAYWDAPNVFVVGDDDQSIYRFQGANISNIIDFYDRHKAHAKIFLMEENYRSTQGILDASGVLIANNKERLVNKLQGLSKELIAMNPTFSKNDTLPEIRVYDNALQEEAGICRELEKLYRQGEDLSEVAVIYRNHRLVANIVKVLERKEIPLNIKQKINILELPLIRNIIVLLDYINEEHKAPHSSEALLFEIMHYSFFGISVRDIAAINKYARKKDSAKKLSWREIIGSREILFRLNLETAKAISVFEENIIYWIKAVTNETVQVLFEKILTKGGLLTEIMNGSDKVWKLQQISTFFDFIKEETARNKYLSLSGILDTLHLMLDNKIPLFLNKVLNHEKGINFLTAHSSKGLEVKHVFLIAASADCWDKAPPRRGFSLPDSLWVNDEKERAEDERRLFYVAMTRAKEKLIISYPARKNNDKETEASRFVAEIISGTNLSEKEITIAEEDLLSFQAELLFENQLPEIGFLDKEFLKKELEDYKMSVTHLNKYLRCPISFYFENVLKVPSARNENMGFGSAVHFALFQLFLQMQQDEKKQFPSLENFLFYFKTGMESYHSHFTQKAFERRLEYGRKILPDYYDNYVNSWNKVVKPEYRISLCEIGGVPVTGALDKIEFDGKNVNVVDYKTGNPENARAKLAGPSEKNPNGGDYWRQIVFYRLLLDNDKSTNYTMASAEIDFIQPDTKGRFTKAKLYVSDEDIHIVQQQIKETYQKIMQFEFTKGCGEENCSWCNFVKYNYNAAMLKFEEQEE